MNFELNLLAFPLGACTRMMAIQDFCLCMCICMYTDKCKPCKCIQNYKIVVIRVITVIIQSTIQ